MALSLGIDGEPGGVSVLRRPSSLSVVCWTVIVCRKSSGKDICPGSRLSNCN